MSPHYKGDQKKKEKKIKCTYRRMNPNFLSRLTLEMNKLNLFNSLQFKVEIFIFTDNIISCLSTSLAVCLVMLQNKKFLYRNGPVFWNRALKVMYN